MGGPAAPGADGHGRGCGGAGRSAAGEGGLRALPGGSGRRPGSGRDCVRPVAVRGHSSAGRAPALQAGGHRFDPGWLHFTRSLGTPLSPAMARARCPESPRVTSRAQWRRGAGPSDGHCDNAVYRRGGVDAAARRARVGALWGGAGGSSRADPCGRGAPSRCRGGDGGRRILLCLSERGRRLLAAGEMQGALGGFRCGCGWGSTRARSCSSTATTSGWRCIRRRGSVRRRTAGRSSSRTRPGHSRASRCGISVSTA